MNQRFGTTLHGVMIGVSISCMSACTPSVEFFTGARGTSADGTSSTSGSGGGASSGSSDSAASGGGGEGSSASSGATGGAESAAVAVAPYPTLALLNVRSLRDVNSGFVVGTLSAVDSRVTSVEASFDSTNYVAAELLSGGTTWRIRLPSGASRLHRYASLSVSVRMKDAAGEVVGEAISGSARIGVNRDMNGDGFPDFAVSTPYLLKGTVQVYRGRTGGLGADGPAADLTLSGETGDVLGESDLLWCDLNADGFADLVMSSIQSAGTLGRVRVVAGGDSAFPSSGATALPLSTLAVSTITGTNAQFYLGGALACGDFNGDGVDDLAVSAWRFEAVATHAAGSVHVFQGASGSDLAATGVSGATVSLESTTADERYGLKLAAADLNGDGLDDLVIAAQGRSSSAGGVDIHRGRSDLSGWSVALPSQSIEGGSRGYLGMFVGVGDLTGDGLPEVLAGSVAQLDLYEAELGVGLASPATALKTISGIGYAGVHQVADVNGDGIADLISGNRLDNVDAYSYAGRVRIFAGTVVEGVKSLIQAENQDSAGIVISGEAASEYLGTGVAAYDFDLDGIDDVFISAPGYDSSKGRWGYFPGVASSGPASSPTVWYAGTSSSNSLGTSLTR